MKKVLFVCSLVVMTIFIYGFAKNNVTNSPSHEEFILSEEGSTHRNTSLENFDYGYSTVTYNFEELKKFVDDIELEKRRGADVKYLKVYVYPPNKKSKKTSFIAPLKKDGKQNHDLKTMMARKCPPDCETIGG